MDTLDASYWNNRFNNRDTPWDMGDVSTPIKEYIDQLTDKTIAILIPGCGNAHEATYLLANGFTCVTVIDISATLTQQLKEKFEKYNDKELTIITGDFFELKGQFDLIIEQTFFCALYPALRKKYVQQMHHLLKAGGKLAGLLFNKKFETAGPPFGGNIDEYKNLFSSLFRTKTIEPCYNSIAPRAGTECFFISAKK